MTKHVKYAGVCVYVYACVCVCVFTGFVLWLLFVTCLVHVLPNCFFDKKYQVNSIPHFYEVFFFFLHSIFIKKHLVQCVNYPYLKRPINQILGIRCVFTLQTRKCFYTRNKDKIILILTWKIGNLKIIQNISKFHFKTAKSDYLVVLFLHLSRTFFFQYNLEKINYQQNITHCPSKKLNFRSQGDSVLGNSAGLLGISLCLWDHFSLVKKHMY